MSLAKGDHLRIQRNGRIIEPEEEAYHEFEVMGGLDFSHNLTEHVSSTYIRIGALEGYSYYDVRIKVVK